MRRNPKEKSNDVTLSISDLIHKIIKIVNIYNWILYHTL